jgi:hypothetical protein
MKGIAFPATEHGGGEEEDAYNASAWIDVLHQLVIDLNVSSLNTVRLYRMNSTVDYTDFFQAAAQLGIYVIVPLTSAKGDGVMDRTLPAPACYNETLFRFGISAIQNYIRYPNCLAGEFHSVGQFFLWKRNRSIFTPKKKKILFFFFLLFFFKKK